MILKTILLVEKDEFYSSRFHSYFEKEGYRIFCADDNEKALEIFTEHNTEINIVIISNHFQENSSYDILKEIRSYSSVPVLLLMENNEPELQMRAYRMGADDCIGNDMPFSLMKMKLKVILKRIYGEESLLKEGILELDLNRKSLKIDGIDANITMKEFKLLQFFMINKDTIQTRNQILTAVWGINYEGSDRIVDSLVKKLRIKLKNASDYIHTVYGMGYCFKIPAKKPEE